MRKNILITGASTGLGEGMAREWGVKALVKAIESEKRRAFVPWWPWTPLSYVLKSLPFGIFAKAM